MSRHSRYIARSCSFGPSTNIITPTTMVERGRDKHPPVYCWTLLQTTRERHTEMHRSRNTVLHRKTNLLKIIQIGTHLQQPSHEDVRVISIATATAASYRVCGAEPARSDAGRVVPHTTLAFSGHREIVVDHDLVHLEDGGGSRNLSHLYVHVCECCFGWRLLLRGVMVCIGKCVCTCWGGWSGAERDGGWLKTTVLGYWVFIATRYVRLRNNGWAASKIQTD